MKKLLSLVGTLALSLFLLSCSQEEEKNEPQGNSSFMGALTAADNITGIELHRLEVDHSSGIEDFELVTGLVTESYIAPYSQENREQMIAYCNSKLSEVRKRLEKEPRSWDNDPIWFDCEISDAVSITCDCVLFGQDPGTNLLHYFKQTMPNDHCTVISSYPDYGVIKMLSEACPLEEYLATGNALPHFSYMQLGFIETPEERPDHMTLTFRIPIKYESWTRFPWMKRNRSIPDRESDTERALEASLEVSFVYGE